MIRVKYRTGVTVQTNEHADCNGWTAHPDGSLSVTKVREPMALYAPGAWICAVDEGTRGEVTA